MRNREIRFNTEVTADAVTVDEVKDWGKIPSSAEDNIIESMIKSCRQLQEQWVGLSYIEKTITGHWNKLEDAVIELPYGPIVSVESIKRVYEDGTLSDALVSGTDYFLSGMDFKAINLYTRWQSAGQIVTGLRVEYTAGYGDNSHDLPEPLKTALLRHVTTDYYQRDDLEVYTPVLYDWVKEALAPYRRDNLWF